MKNIAIFLSSTFNDMQSERDLMRDVIAPELEERLKRYGHNVEFIDLRWGIDTQNADENEANRKILKTCFEEIRNTDPFFIAFIGERYGWVPDHDDVVAAFADEGLDGESVDGKSITELEIECAKRLYPVMDRTLIYFRDEVDYGADSAARDMFVSTGAEKKKLAALKADIARQYPDRVRTYGAVWNAAERRIEGLEKLRSAIIDDIDNIIEQDPALCAPPANATQQSVLVTDGLIERQARTFSGRAAEKAAVREFLKSDKRMLLLTGASGSGKSALLSSLVHELGGQGDTVVLPFFTGADEHCGTAESMMRATVLRAAQALGEDGSAADALGGSSLYNAFNEYLNRLAETKNTVLAVDALNQMAATEYEDKLKWFNPYALSPSVKVIVSATPEYHRLAFVRSLGASVMNLDCFVPDDVRQVAERFFAVNHKQANPKLLAALGERAENESDFRLPIYLLNLLQQLNNIGGDDFKKIKARERVQGESAAGAIVGYLVETAMTAPKGLPAQLDSLLERAAEKAGDSARVFCAAIAVSRYGITERLMSGICRTLGVEYDGASFSYFRRLFKTDLVKRENGAWDFSHALVKAHYAASAPKALVQRILSAVADSLACADDDNAVKRAELCYYLAATDRLGEFGQFFACTADDRTVRASLTEQLRAPDNFEKADALFEGSDADTVWNFVIDDIAGGEFSAELADKYGYKILRAVYADERYGSDGKLYAVAERVYRALGGVAYSGGHYRLSRDYYMLALKLCERTGSLPADIYSALADCYFVLGRSIKSRKFRNKALAAIEAEQASEDKTDRLFAAYSSECDRIAGGAFVKKSKTLEVVAKLTALADGCDDGGKRVRIYSRAYIAAARAGQTPETTDTSPLESALQGVSEEEKALGQYALAALYANADVDKAMEYARSARGNAEAALRKGADAQKLKLLDGILELLRIFGDNAELKTAHAECLNRLDLIAPSYYAAERYITLAHGQIGNDTARKTAKTLRRATARSVVTAEQKIVNYIMLLLTAVVITAYLVVLPIVLSLFRGAVQGERSNTPYGIFVNFYIPAACETLVVMFLSFLLYAIMQAVRPSNDYAARLLWVKRGALFLAGLAAALALYGAAWSYFGDMGHAAFEGTFGDVAIRYVAMLTSEVFVLVLIANEVVNFITREACTKSVAVNTDRFCVRGKRAMLDYTVNIALALAAFGIMFGCEAWFTAQDGMMLIYGFGLFYALCIALAVVYVAKLAYLSAMYFVTRRSRRAHGQNV